MKSVCIRILLSFVLFLWASPSLGAVGRIAELSGTVSYRERGNIPYKGAKKGTEVEQGYWIKTGADGWTVLSLADGSRLTLANNTEIELTELITGKKREGLFTILQGKLRAYVLGIAGETVDYRVKSPTAVVGIRGTEFMMMTQGLANVLFGNEGMVEVAGDKTPAKRLSVDTMVQNTRGYAPADPVEVKPDTLLYAAKKDFEEITAARPPKEWEISGNLPNIIARWNINYGHYLADTGRYEEALYVFQIAIDLTNLPETRGDARLERGAVYSRFLGNPEAALAEYLLVLEEYPHMPRRETALYLTGMSLYEMGFMGQARERLLQYKREYPTGKHITSVETILGVIEK